MGFCGHPTLSTHLGQCSWGSLREGCKLLARWQEERVAKIIWRMFRASFESEALMQACKIGACQQNPWDFLDGKMCLGNASFLQPVCCTPVRPGTHQSNAGEYLEENGLCSIFLHLPKLVFEPPRVYPPPGSIHTDCSAAPAIATSSLGQGWLSAACWSQR